MSAARPVARQHSPRPVVEASRRMLHALLDVSLVIGLLLGFTMVWRAFV